MRQPRARSWVPGLSRLKAWLIPCALGFHVLVGVATAADSRSRKVEVALIGALASEPTLSERISSWFDPTFYDVGISQRQALATEEVLSPESDGAVYVWVILSDRREARLYFATTSPDGTPIYSMRAVALKHGLDEVGAERLSQIVHLSTVALFEGRGEQPQEHVKRMLEQEPAAQEAANPTREPTPAARSRDRGEQTKPRESTTTAGSNTPVEFDAGIGYGASLRGDEGLWHGPRAGLTMTLAHFWNLGLGVQGYLPHTQDLSGVRLAFWGLAFEFGGGVGTRLSPTLDLLARVGPGLELVRYEPVRSLSTEITISGGETEVRPNLGTQIALVRRGAIVDGALVLGGAYALTRTHYDLRTSGRSREIAAPSRFLPSAGVELRF